MESLAKQKCDIMMIAYHQGNIFGCWFLQDDGYDPWEQSMKNESSLSTCHYIFYLWTPYLWNYRCIKGASTRSREPNKGKNKWEHQGKNLCKWEQAKKIF